MAPIADIDPHNLRAARWALVVNALTDTRIIVALWPLISHRARQMGFTIGVCDTDGSEPCISWHSRRFDNGRKSLRDHWGELPPVLIFRPGESARSWLARHGVSPGPVNPEDGVPYYLLIAARPGPLSADDGRAIPFSVQRDLAGSFAVGRACFTDFAGRSRYEDYQAWAERLVASEERSGSGQAAARFIFAPGDQGTRYPDGRPADFAGRLRESLAFEPDRRPDRLIQGDEATREALQSMASFTWSSSYPGVMTCVTRSAVYPARHPELLERQGALICAEWPGKGPVSPRHTFAGTDVSLSLDLSRAAFFLRSSYSAYCPQEDKLIADVQGRHLRLAPFSFIPRLPQRLLLQGAQAVVGYAARVWLPPAEAPDQTGQDVFPAKSLIDRLARGSRAGYAVDALAETYTDYIVSLAVAQNEARFEPRSPDEIARLRTAADERTAIMLLGDPAARLPVAPGYAGEAA